jgi:hypothetical protein
MRLSTTCAELGGGVQVTDVVLRDSARSGISCLFGPLALQLYNHTP